MSEQVPQFPVGLIGEASTQVVPELTARHLGSGTVAVFATPEMVRLMERAAVNGLGAAPGSRSAVGGHADQRPTPGSHADGRHRHRPRRTDRCGGPPADLHSQRPRWHGFDRRGDARAGADRPGAV